MEDGSGAGAGAGASGVGDVDFQSALVGSERMVSSSSDCSGSGESAHYSPRYGKYRTE